jgi:DNA-binding response OmpR family regulator
MEQRPISLPCEQDILIVDDEAGVRDLLAEVLRENGYVVEVAGTVAEASDLLGKCRYQVVVTDWRLPDGDGTLIANLAAELGSHAFLMSGYLTRMLAGNVDPRRTLMKPVLPSELLATVRACIGRASATPDD